MLPWLQRLFGVARLEDLLHVLVEDVHVRVDELFAAHVRLTARVEELEANPVLLMRVERAGEVTPAEVMKVTS